MRYQGSCHCGGIGFAVTGRVEQGGDGGSRRDAINIRRLHALGLSGPTVINDDGAQA